MLPNVAVQEFSLQHRKLFIYSPYQHLE